MEDLDGAGQGPDDGDGGAAQAIVLSFAEDVAGVVTEL